MKELIILPMILAVTVFSLNHKTSEGMDINRKDNGGKEVKVEKRLNIYNNSKNEIDETQEEKILKELFSVEIRGELNITKESNITLNAIIENVEDIEAFNYWWYEDKELLEIGSTLEKAFDKGQHTITVVVRDDNGTEVNSTVVVNAYDYETITSYHYDAYYGGLLYKERTVINHKGNYVLYDDGVYVKEILTYDERGDKLLERVKEFYKNPEENRKTKFTYNDKGYRLTIQTFDNEGLSTSYILYVYDDNSSLIDMKFGINAEDIENNDVSNDDEEMIIYDPSSYIEEKIPEDIVRLNDEGKVVYEENYYGANEKIVRRMRYDENGNLIHSETESKSPYDEGTTIIDYDENGNEINKEYKYKIEDESLCHYSTKRTFTDSNQIESQLSTLLDGECPQIDEIKRLYKYDEEGEVVGIKATIDGEELNEAHSTLEVVKEYTNELDI